MSIPRWNGPSPLPLLRRVGLLPLLLLMGAGSGSGGGSAIVAPRLQLIPAGGAVGTDAADSARALFVERALRDGVHREVLRHFEVRKVRILPAGGTVVSLDARIEGVLVLDSGVEVLLTDDGAPVAISFGPAVRRMAGEPAPLGTLLAPQAVGLALAAMGRPAPALRDEGVQADGWQHLRADDSGVRLARARPALHVDERGLMVPTWEIEAGLAGRDPQGTRFRIDRRSGAILKQVSLQADSTLRVWVEADNRPSDSPNVDVSPHPTGTPDGMEREVIPPTDIEVEGLNLNDEGGSDPWLPADAVTLSGNNTRVYADGTAWGGEAGSEIEIGATSPGIFDATYDFDLDAVANESQLAAAGAQAFYVTNWLHDMYWDAGFDEVAGNAQADNYDRGGIEGDAMEVQLWADWAASERNNAFMTTYQDGVSPIMTMRVWVPLAEVLVDGLSSPLVAGSAQFGATATEVSADLVWLSAKSHIGCDVTLDDVMGKLVLVDRGTCSYATKALNAQNAGALGVILINNVESDLPPIMDWDDVSLGVVVPMVSLTSADGEALAAALDAGPTSVTLVRPPDVDGGVDSGVVAHEWAHFLFYANITCDTLQCQGMTEGWSDATALHMMVREGDDLDGAYPYSAFLRTDPNWAYFGGRRTPYSRDPAINGLSFRHIQNGETLPDVPTTESANPNEEAHNAGEVWASALFDAYLNLIDVPGADFEDVRLRWPALVSTALAIIPDNPSLLEARDGLLAAALVIDPDSVGPMRQGFAGRGMGSCAVGPAGTATTLTGVVEDFDLHPELTFGIPSLDDSVTTCDDDGLLDAGERGLLTIPIDNQGGSDLEGAVVTVTSDDPALTFPEGASISVPSVAAYASGQVSVEVELADDADGLAYSTISLTLTDPTICDGTLADELVSLTNYDMEPSGSGLDTFQAPTTLWTADEDRAPATWSRQAADGDEINWVGLANDFVSDTRLISPRMAVATGETLLLRFTHSYYLQTPGASYRDGATIELRVDGGDWQDLSDWVDPGYGGTIESDTNALYGESAYVGQNASYPDPDTIELDLGQTLGGHDIELAFRLVTDRSVGSEGWTIGEVEFQGLSEGPFATVAVDANSCAETTSDKGDDTRRCGCSAPASSRPLNGILLLGIMAACVRRRRSGPAGRG